MGDMDVAIDQSWAEDGEEYPRWRGSISEWRPPSESGGPARFKIGRLTVQVWPYEFGDEDRREFSETYQSCRSLAMDGAFVEALGEEKDNTFFSKKANKEISTTQRTVYGIAKAERMDGEDDPKPAGPAFKKAASDAKAKGGPGKGKPDTLTKEEWAERDRLQHSAQSVWAAYKVLIPAAKDLGLLTDDGKNIATGKLEQGVRGLVALANKLIADRTLFPERNLSPSGSGSAAPSPSPTNAPEPLSALAPEEPDPSKASKKPVKSSNGV